MECRGYKQREVWKNVTKTTGERIPSSYAVDCPIGLAERGREFVGNVHAGVREGGTATLWPNSASPITAERQVKYYPLSVEMRVVVAIIWEHWEIRYRLTPSGTWKDRLSLSLVHLDISRVGRRGCLAAGTTPECRWLAISTWRSIRHRYG